MESNMTAILLALIKSGLTSTPMQEELKAEYNADMLQHLAKMASRHDLTHLLVIGLINNSLLDKNNLNAKKCIMQATFRYEKIKYELDRICDVFERAEIPFIPLKGSVIRKYYPEPWMRTSCDIDILVSEENSDRAADLLVSELEYIRKRKGSHDISVFTPSNLHIEVHYTLIEDMVLDKISSVLGRVWELSSAIEGSCYRREMCDELFYFYHIAHMAKHFQNGGCGIRTFMDIYILDNIEGADIEKRNALLEEGGMLLFANAARKLSAVWFGEREHDAVTRRMEKFILCGGTYGVLSNKVAVHRPKKGGKFKYLLSKFFIPYDVIKFQYPILQKHKWLLPIMQVRRWGRIIFCGQLKFSVKEMKYNNGVSKSEAEEMKGFLSEIGLLDK